MTKKKIPLSRLGACLGLAGLLAGCSPWTVDKTVVPSDADVLRISKEIQQVRNFEQTVYDVSTFAVDRCYAKTLREPFTLLTLGSLAGVYEQERIAAYWRAEGLDETFRVLWAADDSQLKPGERVVEINGTEIENNKTGMGEYPLVKYLTATIKARAAAYEDGEPYVVTLEDRRQVVVPLVPACRVKVWAMPHFDDEDYSEIPTNRYTAVVLPANAIRSASSVDEYRYLAGLAVYYSASEQASRKQAGAFGVLGLGVGVIAAVPLLYPVVSPLAQGLSGAMLGGMELNAAKFSS